MARCCGSSARDRPCRRQGDPLTPALHALCQHPALVELQLPTFAGEFLFAYLDDIYVSVPSARSHVVLDLPPGLREGLERRRRPNFPA